MKIITAIVITFILAFATSFLYEIDFINNNPVRYILVLLFICIELVIGFYYIKSQLKQDVRKT
jgi:heme A synthase